MANNNPTKRESSYLNNAKLKKAGVKIDFTQDQIQEILKCVNNPLYFINNYVKIISLDEGLIPMKPYPYQEKMISTIHDNRFSIFCVSRQCGKTTSYVAYILWYILFNSTKRVVILANKAKTARSILAKVKLAYEEIPLWLQQGVAEWNKSSIELENGCRVEADSTSGNAARGDSVNLLILDELAFVPANIAEDFFRSVYPTISKGSTTKIVIVSTPNGINLFYKLWQESVAGKNAYMPFTMHWSEVPGRDEKWKEETIKNIGEESFQQEFELSFFGSATNTLIASSKLRSLVFESPIHSERGLDIYEMPQKDHQYVLVADVGRGGGADYSAFTIIDFTDVPYKVVAKYKSNVIKALVFPNVIVEIAKKYNDAYLLIEANDVGSQVADIIRYEHEYENMFCSVLDKKMSMYTITLRANEKTKLGVMTSKKVKNVGCSCLKSLIESDTLIIKDFDIISELTNFVSKETSFGAQIGMNDDLVMTLVLFSWLTQQRFFKQLTDSNLLELLKNNEEKFSNIPFFSYSNGSSKVDSDSSAIDEGDLVIVSQQTWKHY